MDTKMKSILLMCCGIFICMLDSTIMNITLPSIQRDFHHSLNVSSWLLNVYTISIAVFSIPFTKMAEIIGKKHTYIIGLFVFSLGSFLCGISPNVVVLMIARCIQSLGAAVILPLSMIIGIEAAPLNKRHIALTMLGATQGFATAVGPPLGGIITHSLNWHWVFYINVPICIFAMITTFFLLKSEKNEKSANKIDWIGLILSICTIFPLTFVLTNGNSWGWVNEKSLLCYFISFITFVIFIAVERKIAEPMIDLSLFKDKLFFSSSLIACIAFIFFVGVTVVLPQYLTSILHYSELKASLLITPISFTVFCVSSFIGLIIKKIGFVIPVAFGFFMIAVAYILLSHLNIYTTNNHIMLIGIILGIGFSSIIATVTITSSSSFIGKQLHDSQSVFAMLRQIGVILSVAIFVGGLSSNLSDNEQKSLVKVQHNIDHTNLSETKKQAIMQRVKATLGTEINISKVNRSHDDANEKLTNTNKKIIIEQLAISFNKLYTSATPYIVASLFLSLLFLRKKQKIIESLAS